jgi:hypothetical protein
MKESDTIEKRFNARYGHLKQIDPYELDTDFHVQLSDKIMKRVFQRPGTSRIRMTIIYTGLSTAAAVILLLLILTPTAPETNIMTPVVTIPDVSIHDLPVMDEALIREVVVESLHGDESLLSVSEFLSDQKQPVTAYSDADLIMYVVDNMTIDEIILLLLQNNSKEL